MVQIVGNGSGASGSTTVVNEGYAGFDNAYSYSITGLLSSGGSGYTYATAYLYVNGSQMLSCACTIG
jgi:hypothetical protein